MRRRKRYPEEVGLVGTAIEKMLCGERYDLSDLELVVARERARELTARYNDADPGADDEGRRILVELFGSVGEGVHVEAPFRCDYGKQIHVGRDFYTNFDCVILDVCRVDTGDGR